LVLKKIGFISPKSSFYFRNEEKNKILTGLPGFMIYRNFWVGIGSALPILASLTPDKYEIEIIDENIEEIDFNKDYDIIAVTSMTHQAIRAYQICSEFRKKGIYTVIGGVHPSFMHEEAKMFSDTVVIGEAENIWPELLKDFENNKIKEFYFQNDYQNIEIDKMPIPRYDLLKGKNHSIIWINTSRGCPYDCEFCSVVNLFGKKCRHKTVSQITNEIKFIQKEFKRIFIGFSDDNMFIDKNFSKELMTSFKNLNFRWVCQSDISIGNDKDFLKSLFNAGCHVIFIGFESLNEKNLTDIYGKTKKLKKEFLPHYYEMVDNIQKSGLGILGSFIVGLDNDTEETFENISDFVDKSNMLTATLNVLTPLPGTRLRERLLKENRIIPTSWDNYTFWDINFIPKNLTFRNIENGMMNSLKKIYSLERMKKTTAFFKEIFKEINKEQL